MNKGYEEIKTLDIESILNPNKVELLAFKIAIVANKLGLQEKKIMGVVEIPHDVESGFHIIRLHWECDSVKPIDLPGTLK